MSKKYKCDYCGLPTDNDNSIMLPSGNYLDVHRCDKCDKRFGLELDWENKGATYMETELVCPYCQTSYDDYDAWGFDEGTTNEVECSFCGKKFDLDIRVERTYSTKRSVCEMPDDWNGDDE